MKSPNLLTKFSLSLTVVGLGLLLNSAKVQAQTSANSTTTTNLPSSIANNSNSNTSPFNSSSFTVPSPQNQQIQQEAEKVLGTVKNPIENISDTIKNLSSLLDQMLQSFIGSLKIPDLGEVVEKIMSDRSNDNEGTKLSANLEKKPQGSYSIQEDLAKRAEQRTATTTALDATLSKAAQNRQTQIARIVEQNVSENIQLGEESQNQDVTQHIMRNISQQTALAAQNQGVIILQNQQAQIDRALANTLIAQQAKELGELNVSQRRQDAAAATSSSTQAGLFQMPGGITLGEQEK